MYFGLTQNRDEMSSEKFQKKKRLDYRRKGQGTLIALHILYILNTSSKVTGSSAGVNSLKQHGKHDRIAW